MRQGRRKHGLSTGLSTPQTPICITLSPQMSSPGLCLGDRLQPPMALGFVSSAPPVKIGTICSVGAGKAWGEPWEGAAGQPPLDPPCFAHGSQAKTVQVWQMGRAAWS